MRNFIAHSRGWLSVPGIMALTGVLVLAIALAGCGLQQDISQIPPEAGALGPATPINAPTLSGKPFKWSTTHGHVVLLDFWGSWCSPCRAEQSGLNGLYTEFTAKGVIFLGVDLQDTNVDGSAYERDLRVAYPSVNDASEVVASDYNVLAPPSVIIINSKGKIVDRFLGTLVGVQDDLNRLT
jgi:thiol-disulfide isomerase/thioredoxin